MTQIAKVEPGELARAEWIAERDSVLVRAGEIVSVDSDEDYSLAGDVLAELRDLLKGLETQRKELTSPLDKMKKQIIAQEKTLAQMVNDEYERLRKECGDYALARRKLIEAQAQARAEAEMDAAMMQDVFADSQAVAVPKVDKMATSAGVKQVEVVTFTVVDPEKVDRKFMSVDESKIRAYCQFIKKMGQRAEEVHEPGIVFRTEIRIDGK